MSDNSLSKKQYYLTHEVRSEYLYVLVTASDNDYEIARSYWDEIMQLLDRNGTKRLLVEKDIRAELSVADEFRIASEIAAGMIRWVKLALCERHISQENLEFGELVATNRGLNTRSFSDFLTAKNWLLAS
ncbi:MAG: hypothetical protein ABJA02_01790 [Acidobacteriota bacterium]